MRPFPSVWPAALSLTLLGDATAGCGHRATQADCQLIVNKSVELELREKQTSPEAIQKREEQVRSELEEQIKSCEGRRVTEKTMVCVQNASTTKELEQCLR